MSKLIVMINSKSELELLKNKKIDGIILSIKDLSVNSSFFIDKEELTDIIENYNDKEIFISLNKIMHNMDIDNLRNTLNYLAGIPHIKVLFYDLSVLNIVVDNNLDIDLVIYQEHLNASMYSNSFYNKKGVNYSFITSDITIEEINEIKDNTNMKLMKVVYGYLPIFYSRRYLISCYLEYINKDIKKDIYYLKDNDDYYLITEEDYGTTIYTKDKINLINEIDKLDNIDYLVINSYMTNINNVDKVVDDFINKNIDNIDHYEGFFNTKTVFKVKEHD